MTTIKTKITDARTKFEVTTPNMLGETLTFELIKCTPDNSFKTSLPNLWKKYGYTDKVLDTYYYIDTYVYDSKGNCTGKYNPQNKLSDDGKRYIIDFKYMLEATDENKMILINEVLNRFSAY